MKIKKDTIIYCCFGVTISTLLVCSIVYYQKTKKSLKNETNKNSMVDTFLSKRKSVDTISMSSNGIDFLKKREKLMTTAYKDGGGVWTIGYGHTGNVKSGDTITEKQAEKLLKDDVQIRVDSVKKYLKNNGINNIEQNVFDMLVSHKFNTGSNYDATKHFIEWGNTDTLHNWWNTHYITINGNYSQGLLNRRNAELDILKNGY